MQQIKIAYCIICHKNTSVLRETINILSENENIYIHVDKKSNVEEFLNLNRNVNVIKERVDIRWGSFSQIQATINLLKSTINKDYDYIFLLSGDCLPFKSKEDIKRYVQQNKGKEFISIQNNPDKNLLERRLLIKYNKIWWKKSDQINFIEKLLRGIQYKFNLFPTNSLYWKLPKLYKGSNWFGITKELRDYILNYLEINDWYLKAFEKSYCGDEIFFQTLIMNSPFRFNIYKLNSANENLMSLRYIDWSSGPDFPKILNEEDFNKIKGSNALFGRKFNESLNIENIEPFLV